ncbi:hypothetical protein [Nocardia brasiliensis]|uniref:hypothetical protein n=1 Tax=Nocardia brasiliensis TaxID=37326 RepID=UPI0024557945|nr:hypothetical protein [Nocardia brasiliensis]
MVGTVGAAELGQHQHTERGAGIQLGQALLLVSRTIAEREDGTDCQIEMTGEYQQQPGSRDLRPIAERPPEVGVGGDFPGRTAEFRDDPTQQFWCRPGLLTERAIVSWQVGEAGDDVTYASVQRGVRAEYNLA